MLQTSKTSRITQADVWAMCITIPVLIRILPTSSGYYGHYCIIGFYGHQGSMDIKLLWPSDFYGHQTSLNISVLWTSVFFEHQSCMDISVL